MRKLTPEELAVRVAAYREHGNQRDAAKALGIGKSSFGDSMIRAAELGLLGTEPVLPGFRISQTTAVYRDGLLRGEFVQQKAERGEVFEVPAGQRIKGVSALVSPDGREIIKWVKTGDDLQQQAETIRVVVDELKAELPTIEPVSPPTFTKAALLNQYTITDLHMGMLAWREETGDEDYDLRISEALLIDWFTAAIEMAPAAETAILAQIGDLLHHDSHESVTPAHRHVLDADSRLQKMVRIVIRTIRRIVAMLLQKHAKVHIIMADANHDPASEAWLRELFAAFYEGEPRVSVDSSAGTYYVFEHGDVSLFYHHGHRRKIETLDSVFAGKFRSVYGRTRFSYAHTGHLHSDALKSTNLMRVERHETLAAPDAYAANGGWLSGRSAKVITYHKQFGEVGRVRLTPEMVRGWSAANDNVPTEQRRAA